MQIRHFIFLAIASFSLWSFVEHVSEHALAAGKTGARAAPAKKGAGGVREKNIIREKVYRGESKKVDFDAIDIGGERKTPFGSIINQNKPKKEYDLIKIRTQWNPEMIQSTSSLETGRSGN